jgi:hypothetical protein
MEYREGNGRVVFCQLDVTGRSETDPAANAIVRSIFASLPQAAATRRREVVYAGEPAGLDHLQAAGVAVSPFKTAALAGHRLLVVGPGGASKLTDQKNDLARWLQNDGRLLAIGLDETELAAVLSKPPRTGKAEHIAAFFDPPKARSPLAGVGPADVHNRDPRELPLISHNANAIGDGVIAVSADGHIVYCQLAPWQFEYNSKPNIKRTYRRASFLLSRLLANLGATSNAPILERIETPVSTAQAEARFKHGLYLDQPEEWDDPYRFFRW